MLASLLYSIALFCSTCSAIAIASTLSSKLKF